jgi:hypothetical protein
MDSIDITDDSLKRKREMIGRIKENNELKELLSNLVEYYRGDSSEDLFEYALNDFPEDLLNYLSNMGSADMFFFNISCLRALNARSKVKLIIHHQSPSIELVSPLYYSDGTEWYLLPEQRVDVGLTMQAGFNIDLSQEEPTGILMYKLKRKNNEQSNNEIISNKEEAICVQFIIIWNAWRLGELSVASDLIEHDKDRIWDEDKLVELIKCYKLFNIQHETIEETILMRDNTMLMTILNATREEEYYKLDMTISETSIKDDTRRPYYFDMDR